MTVSSEVSRNEYVGDGSTTEFVYRNKIFATSDLDVFLDGVEQTLTTHYTVTIDSEDNEATVTFLTAPGVDASVVLIGDVPNTQGSSYPQGGSFPSSVTENALDRRTLVAQKLAEQQTRSLRYRRSDASLPSGELPTLASLKGNLLGFSASTGAPIAIDPTTLDAPSATSSAVSWGDDYDLSYGSGVDQSVALQAVLNTAAANVASFGPQVVRLLSTGGALRLSNRVKVPAGVTLDVSQIIVELGQYGEILIQGELDETPDENLYQLAATASAGATSITIDTTPQGGHTAWAVDTFGVLRGENDANGIAKQRAYFRVTSKDTSGGNAAVVLGIDPPLPDDQGTFLTTYPDSDWEPSVGGPVTDRSLITIATASLLAGNVSRGDTSFSVADGSIFAAGDVCMLQDDRHATDPGSETGGLPMRQELVRVRSVATNLITLEKAVSRDFLTSENAALFKVNPVTDAHIVAGKINQVEAVDASPESRTHATLMFFADRCSVSGVRLLEDDNSYSPRGSACRVTRSLECRVSDVWRVGPKNTSSGDGNGVMVAYSADCIVDQCYLERCRHGVINQGATRTIVRDNTTANCLINGLDDHGVYETDSKYYDNLVVAGPSNASGSTQQLGMTIGNTRWLEGSHHTRVWNNKFVGFGGGSNGGIAVRQASDDVLIQGNAFDGCEVGIRVQRDSRAGVRVTTDVVIRDNQFRDCTSDINADGGLDDWAVDVTYSGTTARPVSVLASNGNEYSTATTKLGGSEPSHGSGTTNDWLFVGAAINGVNGLRIYDNDTDGSSSLTTATITGLYQSGDLIDEDDLVSDDDTRSPSQQSVKAYVDTNVANLEAAIDAVAVGVTHNSSWRTPTVTSNEMTLSSTLDIALADDGAGAIVDRIVRLINDTPANALTVFLPNDATAAKGKFYCYVPTTQAGAVTIKVAAGAGGTGTVDGVAGGTGRLAPKPGSFFLVVCESNAGDEPVYRTSIVDYDDTINFIIDGGGSAITTGVKGDVQVDFDCTILSATALADQSGSIVVDIWKDTYANFPPTDADSITASAPVTISTATKSTDSTLTGWTTAISAGDILRYNVDSITTCERVTVALKVRR